MSGKSYHGRAPLPASERLMEAANRLQESANLLKWAEGRIQILEDALRHNIARAEIAEERLRRIEANPTEAKHQSKPGVVEPWSVGLSQDNLAGTSPSEASPLGKSLSGLGGPTT